MTQFFIFVKKEWLHIWRDKRTLIILLFMPLVLIIVFGFALTNEVRNARIAIFDQSNDAATIAITDKINASRYFQITGFLHSYADIEATFRRGKTSLAIVFPQNFEGDLHHHHKAQIQLIADASDPNTGNTLTNYVSAIIRDYQQSLNQNKNLPFTISTRLKMLYNPELKSAYSFVPGIMGVVLMLVSTLMTTIAIVREKELGTLEVIFVSPLKPVRMIIAKTIPYLAVSIFNIASILLISVYILDVPINGSILLLVAENILFTLTALAIGILISTGAKTQQTAMTTSLMTLFLPTLLFSGFMFPIENMPKPLQLFANVVPAKWYYIIMESVMIKGLGFTAVWKETMILTVMTLILFGVSIKNFKIRLA